MAGLLPVWAMGILRDGPVADFAGDYRRYSMNILAPFWPQSSGLFRWTGIYWLTRGSIGATPGQYEGFCYLGGGGLLLLMFAVTDTWRLTQRWCLDHLFLLLVLVALTIWALSDRIYIGPYLVLSYETPGFLAATLLGWFRSSGRFFWPVAWLLLAWGIAATFTRRRRDMAVGLAILALVLQWVDTTPWRDRLSRLRKKAGSIPLAAYVECRKPQDIVDHRGFSATC
jgi:hypothetical protein